MITSAVFKRYEKDKNFDNDSFILKIIYTVTVDVIDSLTIIQSLPYENPSFCLCAK